MLPRLGPRVPRRRHIVLAGFGRAVLRLMRFRVEGEVPDLARFVIAVAPHTSNWDFVVGAAVMFALELRVAFIAKHTLFRGPFGAVMRWMGGVPVDRSRPHGLVAEAVRGFSRVEGLVLAIAPQGTRNPSARFRSGFLHIARGAGVPVVLAALDWGERRVRLGPAFAPGPDIEGELARTESFFATVRGRR
ncbi:MAG TPA: 1-acyl-sn-glycerol-3-phosphate acyltransferase, partial [Usitatibacter sp.]|nr:1-acyl-sn-glycerol-3-phosphate acyltransferase [Usitatibacter sp.]